MSKRVPTLAIKTFAALLSLIAASEAAQALGDERIGYRLEASSASLASDLDEPGEFAVHLASYHRAADAEAGWKILRARHHALQSAEGPLLREVDLGERGIFVRLLAGPFASFDQVRSVCAAVRRTGDYCAPADTGGSLQPANQDGKR